LAYINAASEHAFSAMMIDQDMSSIPLPTDETDGASRAESATAMSEHTSYETNTMETSGDQAQTLGASDEALLPPPSLPNHDAEAQGHETTEPDSDYSQILNVSSSIARCIA
jgi:hypothetical protein